MNEALEERFATPLRMLRNIKRRLAFLRVEVSSGGAFHTFCCNICGKSSSAPLSKVQARESPSCCHCGSNRRLRSIIAALSQELFGEVRAIRDFRESKHIAGIGLSDSPIYATPLSRKLNYRNTYYHREPKLDITAIGEEMHDTAEFLISSDVFEHICPPVDIAFSNMCRILRRGGVCVFSVPYRKTGATVEYFPELFEYKIARRNGRQVLVNVTLDGREQVFENLVFHGGRGATLEMRQLSEPSLLDSIARAGFHEIKMHGDSIPEHGILLEKDAASLILTMRKP